MLSEGSECSSEYSEMHSGISECFAEGSAELSEGSDGIFRKNIVGCTPATYESERVNIAYSEHSNITLISVENLNSFVKVNDRKYITLILNLQ